MSFFNNLYDALCNASLEDYTEAVREYACPAATGAILLPLMFVTGGTGIAACYTANTIFSGAAVGMLAHSAGNGAEIIREGINIRAGQGPYIHGEIYKDVPGRPQPAMPAMRERPLYRNL